MCLHPYRFYMAKRAGAASNKETSLHQMPEGYYKNSMYYPGKMGKADMPADSHMSSWPDRKMGDYPPLDDTMSGVQSTQAESYTKAKSHISYQK